MWNKHVYQRNCGDCLFVYHDPFFVSVSALLGKEQFIAFYLTGGTVTATNSKKGLWDREENAQYRL